MKILVMGLPNAGKTTLATALAERLRCPHHLARLRPVIPINKNGRRIG
jgi:adenylate kinase family enzyme